MSLSFSLSCIECINSAVAECLKSSQVKSLFFCILEWIALFSINLHLDSHYAHLSGLLITDITVQSTKSLENVIVACENSTKAK